MRTPALLGVLLLAISVFSGCFGGDGGTTSTSTTSASEGATGGTTPAGPGTTTKPKDQPPRAVITVTLNGTQLEPENGSIRANASQELTFDSEGSSDPDNGTLTFAWDFGDGNVSDDAVATNAFTVGNYTVVLTVTDEANQSESTRVDLTIVPAKPDLPPMEKFNKSGTLTMTQNATNTAYWTGNEKQSAYQDLFFPVKPGAKKIYAVMTYTKAPNASGQGNVMFLDFYIYNAAGQRTWTRGSDPMPMVITIEEKDLLAKNGIGTLKAQASCFTCASTNYSFEVRVYYELPT